MWFVVLGAVNRERRAGWHSKRLKNSYSGITLKFQGGETLPVGTPVHSGHFVRCSN